MYLVHLKSAFRNIRKNKIYASINIVGLAVGIASSLLIFLVIHFELSYDRQQTNYNQLYRVVTTYSNHSNGEQTDHQSGVSILLPDALRNDFPQLEKVAPVWNIGNAQIHILGKKGIEDEHLLKRERGSFFVDPALFDMFDFSWLDGNAAGLKDPNTVVLDQRTANDFFGDWKTAMGRTIQLWSFRVPLRVVGVFKDLPPNTDLEVMIGASYATFRQLNASAFLDNKQWANVFWSSECFVKMPAGTAPEKVQSLLPGFVKKYFPAEQVTGSKMISLTLQPLKSVHLDERFSTFKGDALTSKQLWALGLVGLFLLLVACINFVNLSTAQSVNRAKEIGVRKVLGSNRGQLLGQLMQETAGLTLIAMLTGVGIAWLAVPFLSHLMQKPLQLDLVGNPSIIIFLIVTTVVVTILSGLYPGLILSGFNPVEAIKSKISTKTVGGISLRRGLVVLQFVIAQLLMIGTLVVLMQMKLFQNQSLGFDKNAVAMVELPSDSLDKLKYPYLKEQFTRIPGVTSASFCMDAPASFGSFNQVIYFDTDPVKKDFSVAVQYADSDYLKTFRIGLASGRLPYKSDTVREYLVNQTLARRLGFQNDRDILGKMIGFGSDAKFPIVGVMHDFNTKSLREPIGPLILGAAISNANFLSFRMDGTNVQASVNQVQKTFSQVFPHYLFDLNFMDQRIQQFYAAEATISSLFSIFAGIAILISCLGLYGLISFMAVQKTREIGIRKVLGASARSIVYLFSKEFVVLIGIAFLIAAPIGYYFMHQWLLGFYYHISIGAEVFVITLASSLIIALLTVGYKATRAALTNPIQNLRTE